MRTNVKVRLLSVLLTVILCATMLTACGKSSGKRTLSVSFLDNYFDFVPGEDGVVKVEGNTVYYEDHYEVYDVENDIIREMTVFSDGQPGSHFKMNEFSQLMKVELYDSNGVYYELEYTYQEIPVES